MFGGLIGWPKASQALAEPVCCELLCKSYVKTLRTPRSLALKKNEKWEEVEPVEYY